MSSRVAFYFAAFAVILTQSTVKGQCTVQGCESGDPSISIVAEIQQLRIEIFDHLNKQVQNIHELLIAAFQQNLMTSQHDAVMRSLQTVDRRLEEHDICVKQVQSIHELLNESFQEMKSQHGTVITSLQAVNRRLQEHDISIQNQNGNAWKLANGICGPTAEVCDCSDIKASGQIASGVYEVCVVHQRDRICTNAFCDMDTNNGTSLVFQRRRDGSVNFYRTWAEYKEGFGDRKGEFWLGNEMLYLLTSKRNYKLRVDLEDFEGTKRYAEYTRFSISSSTVNYTLAVGEYSGDAGDSLIQHNGQQFSTKDVDNDKKTSSSCAESFRGAWWYYSCYNSNLNGIYHRGNYSGSASQQEGIQWNKWHGYWYSLKSTEMKILPVA